MVDSHPYVSWTTQESDGLKLADSPPTAAKVGFIMVSVQMVSVQTCCVGSEISFDTSPTQIGKERSARKRAQSNRKNAKMPAAKKPTVKGRAAAGKAAARMKGKPAAKIKAKPAAAKTKGKGIKGKGQPAAKGKAKAKAKSYAKKKDDVAKKMHSATWLLHIAHFILANSILALVS